MTGALKRAGSVKPRGAPGRKGKGEMGNEGLRSLSVGASLKNAGCGGSRRGSVQTQHWRGVDSNLGFRDPLLSPTARPWSRRLLRRGAGFRVDTLVQIDAAHLVSVCGVSGVIVYSIRRFSSLSPRIQ